ncbi:hypothetical protein BDB00DRAFT_825961 [Zychaea mexicana]|uniref:uncharacterized protein n=1 Tax=Zychaea mexicana TaxID=64656 RepID=UPI0022FE482D|nr:uncharacterized protein BDB00DRAFT_825961 [Zychaea mexicana]KAI9492878.1 hypothetical protein BDB00DRAFT_825961 [Zychaea mexicana]
MQFFTVVTAIATLCLAAAVTQAFPNNEQLLVKRGSPEGEKKGGSPAGPVNFNINAAQPARQFLNSFGPPADDD